MAEELYTRVTEILRGDTWLADQVNYSDEHDTIRRAFTPQGKWKRLIVYQLQPEVVKADFTPQIRDVPLFVRVYDRESDVDSLGPIGERIVLLLDGADLSVAGKVHCYNCSYTGQFGAVVWDEEAKAFQKILRFMITFRVDEVVG